MKKIISIMLCMAMLTGCTPDTSESSREEIQVSEKIVSTTADTEQTTEVQTTETQPAETVTSVQTENTTEPVTTESVTQTEATTVTEITEITVLTTPELVPIPVEENTAQNLEGIDLSQVVGGTKSENNINRTE